MSSSPIRKGALLVLAVGLMLTACREADPQVLEPPATKVPIEGTDRYRLTLTPKAVERLDIQTSEVIETELGPAVSSDALILEPDGRFWVYVTPADLQYERVELLSVREEDGTAYFSAGPAVGVEVVVVGVPELWGEETGVGK